MGLCDNQTLTLMPTGTFKKGCASNRSTNAKAARLQPTTKALASVLLSDGRLRHCA